MEIFWKLDYYISIYLFIGNIAVIRAYVAKATTMKERTGAVALVTACQSLGSVSGPGRRIWNFIYRDNFYHNEARS